MRKKITLLLVLCITFLGINAQEIATFEDGSTTVGTIVGADATQQTTFSLSTDNPDKTGINTSDKCMYILSNQLVDEDLTAGRPTWNGNIFTITFDAPIAITDANKYLHIMHNKESLLNQWLIYAENGDETYVELGRGSMTEAGVWEDLVVDVKAKLSMVKSIRIHLDGNWTGGTERFYAPTKFYYDNIALTDDVTPRGLDGEFITRQNLLDFQFAATTTATADPVTQSENYIVNSDYTNPDMNGLNATEKCIFWSPNGTAPAWWHGIDFVFTKPVSSATNNYLHILMKKSVTATANTQVSLFNVSGTQTGAALMDVPVTDEWVDYVMEIPATHAIFTRIFIKFNAQIGVDCYADEIAINSDPAPRTAVVTSINKQENASFKLYQNNGSIVFNADTEHAVNVYSISGRLLHKGSAASLSVKVPQSGVYIVRVNNQVRKIVVN